VTNNAREMSPKTQGFVRTWTEESRRYRPRRRETAFLVLAGIFLADALLGELIGGKLIQVRGWVMSIGVIPWPIVFVATDVVNEFYGPRAVRRLTLLAVGLILYTFLTLLVCMSTAAAPFSPVSDAAFQAVFGQSLWIIAGSVVAFAISQLIDAAVFVLAKSRTRAKWLWLRAVGSTLVSQLVDTFVINTIAFGIPKKISYAQVVELSATNYGYKVLIAIATTPIIYLGHSVMARWLAGDERDPELGEPEDGRLRDFAGYSGISNG
jgi:queuosine precursor transporter